MSTEAVIRLDAVREGKACSCPGSADLLGNLTCATCGGQLVLLSARERMLIATVVEAARGLMAAQLRLERAQGAQVETEPEILVADAWQTFRDALWAERRARGGDR
jgi:hypothetical protein